MKNYTNLKKLIPSIFISFTWKKLSFKNGEAISFIFMYLQQFTHHDLL